MTTASLRPRRSCLYMPASNARALEKAKTLAADTIIFDLEDSVAPQTKPEARDKAAEAVRQGGYGSREIVVRINALETEWGPQDLEALCQASPDAILVPKITTADDINKLCALMDSFKAPAELDLWVMIEMPLAVLNIAEIAATAAENRLSTFVMGFNDLAKEMNAEPDKERTVFHSTMSQVVMAARAHELTAIDSVYNDFNDPEGLTQECQQALGFGFDGKSLIHPTQIDIANQVFSPTEQKIAEARAIIAAFDQPENADKGVITVDGKMTERLHLEQAEKTVAMIDAIAATAQ